METFWPTLSFIKIDPTFYESALKLDEVCFLGLWTNLYHISTDKIQLTNVDNTMHLIELH
jgi:hypothetical protein